MAKGFGGGGFGQMQNLLKQASQMQGKITKAQEEAEAKLYTVESAGGSIKIEINGKYVVQSLKLDPSLLEDHETLEDALRVAMNDANQTVANETKKIMDQASAGMKIPGLF